MTLEWIVVVLDLPISTLNLHLESTSSHLTALVAFQSQA